MGRIIKTVKTPINIDNGYKNISQGDMKSTMELFEHNDGSTFIEWDIPDLDENIGIGIEHENKIVTGYDGVFELSDIHIKFLEKNGYDLTEIKNI